MLSATFLFPLSLLFLFPLAHAFLEYLIHLLFCFFLSTPDPWFVQHLQMPMLVIFFFLSSFLHHSTEHGRFRLFYYLGLRTVPFVPGIPTATGTALYFFIRLLHFILFFLWRFTIQKTAGYNTIRTNNRPIKTPPNRQQYKKKDVKLWLELSFFGSVEFLFIFVLVFFFFRGWNGMSCLAGFDVIYCYLSCYKRK